MLGHFFGIFRSFFEFGGDLFNFFDHLRSKLRFETIFLIFHRFFMDFGKISGEFSDDFSRIFQIFLENADLQNSCAHAVFRKGRAFKN